MTYIVTVSTRLPRWPRSEQRLVLDVETRQHYRIVTVHNPWRSAPFSRVYATDATGWLKSVEGHASGQPRMVAGGDDMDTDEAQADLTHRLERGTLLTEEESRALDMQLIDSDIEAFKRYITPTPRE